MTPNLTHAQQFLTALDEDSDTFGFQTFDDSQKHDRKLIRRMHGSLEEHADELTELNRQGAGIFVTVNETNGKGRAKADITRIRALFVDLDGSPIAPVQKSRPEPHIVVQSSPGKFHAYWRVSDCDVNQCEPALKQLINRFDADKACSDRSRVLRLPGFFHQKAQPHLVQVIESNPGACRMQDFAFQGLANAETLHKGNKSHKSSEYSFVSCVESAIQHHLPTAFGERNRCLFALARHLKGLIPDATKQELRSIVARWHELSLPNIRTSDPAESWGEFWRGWNAVRTPFGSVLNRVLEEIDMSAPVPYGIKMLNYGDKAVQLYRICKHLQRNAGQEPFFISARTAGELLDTHFTAAAAILSALVADEVLELVTRGAGKKASTYRYIWHEE